MPSKNKLLYDVSPVYIEWIDSIGTGGWGNYKGPSDLVCVSVGHLISKTKDRVTLCLNKHHTTTGDVMEIPLFAIKRIRSLKT